MALLSAIFFSKDFKEATPVMELLRTKGVRVFVPQNWTGIKDVVLDLEFKEGMPKAFKPPPRKVNPILLAKIKPELERLRDAIWRPSNSPYCSPIVVADKATDPFFRICGDYAIFINKWIIIGHFPVPDIPLSLNKITGHIIFIDLDMANSFHQFLLSAATSAKLSLQTPIGQFEPKFLPEGVAPASGLLQKHVNRIFSDFEPWSICIYDNFLLLATSYADAYEKLEKFLDRCIEHNVFLKPSKSWFGTKEVNFFGYKCTANSYRLDDERKKAVSTLPMPTSATAMHRFLGAALFFSPFIPHFSQLAGPLYDMLKKNFNWDPATWATNYEFAFKALTTALADSLEVFHPQYHLAWFLRCDASNIGLGAVLFQVIECGDVQPIAFVSWKFSEPASRWSVIEREAYAIFYSVKKLSPLLRCKSFTIETDHQNLLWMASSQVPKIMRMHAYLQSYDCRYRHIPGRTNRLADELSRNFPSLSIINQHAFECLQKCHNAKVGHFGPLRTYKLVRQEFPEVPISYVEAREFCEECATCQKCNQPAVPTFKPLLKTIPHSPGTVALDTVSLLLDNFGNKYIFIITNLFTKLCHLYAVPENSGELAADCLLDFYITYGGFSKVHSDPGSEFTATVFRRLTSYFGAESSITMVDNPWADGVEPTVKQCKRHLVALVMDERVKQVWSSTPVLKVVQFILNCRVHPLTGATAYQLTFGTLENIPEMFVPADVSDVEKTGGAAAYLQKLNENLLHLRKIYEENEAKWISEHKSDPLSPHPHYQQGDFVLHIQRNKYDIGALNPRHKGPFRVHSHKTNSNRVTVYDLVNQVYKDLNAGELIIFSGTTEQAFEAAMRDADQYVVTKVLGYRGSPFKRSTMEIFVEFNNGTTSWLTFKDVAQCSAWEKYCDGIMYMVVLNYSAAEVGHFKRSIARSGIDNSKFGDSFFMNLRAFGAATYADMLKLPDRFTVDYWVVATIRPDGNAGIKKVALVDIPSLKLSFEADCVFVHMHLYLHQLPTGARCLTPKQIKTYGLLNLPNPEDESK